MGLFDPSTWGSGVCHTWSLGSLVSWTFCWDREKIFAPKRLLGINIYLHDKSQFWPGLGMGRIGLSDQTFLPKNIEWEESFQGTSLAKFFFLRLFRRFQKNRRKKLMEFSIKGSDPPSQHPRNGKRRGHTDIVRGNFLELWKYFDCGRLCTFIFRKILFLKKFRF